MAIMGWKDTIEKEAASSWRDTIEKDEESSALDATVMHGLQGASAGFLDEMSGLVEGAGRAAGIRGLGGSFQDIEQDKDGPTLDWETLRDAYIEGRNRKREILKQQSKEHPKISGASEFVGMAASPLNKIVGGLSLAKGGAVLGGINAAGSSEADNAMDLAKDTAIGSTVGLVLGKGLDKASPYIEAGLQKVSSGAGKMANRFAARALGAERGTIKKLGADKVEDVGRYALDEGLLSPLANTDDIIARNAAKQAAGGAKMGEVYRAVDEAGGSTFNPLDVASKVDDQIGGFYRTPINRGETAQLENTLESILMRGDQNIPLAEAQALKQELGKVANWKNNINITEKEKMAREAYGIVSRNIDEAVESGAKAIGSDSLLTTLKEGKRLYGNSKAAETLLENKLAREQGNKLVGLTDWGVLGAGGAAAPITGGASIPATLALYGLKKGAEKYGAQNSALVLNKISKSLLKSPKMAEVYKTNPELFQSIVTKLEERAGAFAPSLPAAADNKPKPLDKNVLLQKTQGTKFGSALQKAAEKGDASFNAAHWVLHGRDPEYRKAVDDGK